MIVAIIVIGSIFWYKKRSARKFQNAQVEEHTRGKRGYGLADEKEDDDEDDDRSAAIHGNMRISYKKPTLK